MRKSKYGKYMKHILPIIIAALVLIMPAYGQPKLSPLVRQALSHADRSSSLMAKGGKHREQTLTAFVRTDDVSLLTASGCRIHAQWDDIVIASIPLHQLRHLSSLPQVKRIEAGRSCTVAADSTAAITHARDVWQLTAPMAQGIASNITGKGVVMGVMDIGFDLTHPAFYAADGQSYRIKALWDQLDTTGNGEDVLGIPNEGDDPVNIGRQYVGMDMLLNRQHSFDGLQETHGTHTTGIAATMAPEADICLVANFTGNNKNLVPEEEQYKYTNATDMLGFKYIFDYADSQGKPCVISFSEGAPADLYQDGLAQEVLGKMVGPGHILCASAGNEGISDGTYMHKTKGESRKRAFLAKWASNTAPYVMSSTKPVSMSLSFYQDGKLATTWNYDATELSNYPDSVMTDTLTIGSNKIAIYLETYPSCYDETLYATDFILEDLQHSNCGYAVPTMLTIEGEDNDIEVFFAGGYFVSNSIEPALHDYDVTHNILSPGCLQDAVCVGATSYVTKVRNISGNYVGSDYGADGIVARYSSIGPTISGLTKPDVTAPGSNIVSSFNSFWREANPNARSSADIRTTEFNSRTYPWGIDTGTSMATPVVASIVALWLQLCPTLTPDEVKDVIAHTSTHYNTSLTYPNNRYGWGQIDALKGIRYIEQVYTGIEHIHSNTPSATDGIYDLFGRRLTVLPSSGVYIKVSNGKAIKAVRSVAH